MSVRAHNATPAQIAFVFSNWANTFIKPGLTRNGPCLKNLQSLFDQKTEMPPFFVVSVSDNHLFSLHSLFFNAHFHYDIHFYSPWLCSHSPLLSICHCWVQPGFLQIGVHQRAGQLAGPLADQPVFL